MNKNEVIKFVNILGVSYSDKRSNYKRKKHWLTIQCPFAEKTHRLGTDSTPSAGIRVRPEPNLFNCFTCKMSGSLGDLIEQLLDMDLISEDKFNVLKDLCQDDGSFYLVEDFLDEKEKKTFNKLRFNKYTPPDSEVISYLSFRKVKSDVIDKYEIMRDGNYIVFPLKNKDGEIVGAAKRKMKGKGIRWNYEDYSMSDMCLFGEQFFKDGSDVLLVEGHLDVLYTVDLVSGILPLCPNGSFLSRYQESILRRAGSIIIMADEDKAGKKLRKEVIERVGQYVPMMFVAQLPDGADPNDLSIEELTEIYDNRKIVKET